MPLVLAQLLIQFQKPIDVENPLQNATSNPINDTLLDRLNNTTFERNVRSISYGEETINGNTDARIKERFVAPEFPTNGTISIQ